jgi:hypothetical protein
MGGGNPKYTDRKGAALYLVLHFGSSNLCTFILFCPLCSRHSILYCHSLLERNEVVSLGTLSLDAPVSLLITITERHGTLFELELAEYKKQHKLYGYQTASELYRRSLHRGWKN